MQRWHRHQSLANQSLVVLHTSIHCLSAMQTRLVQVEELEGENTALQVAALAAEESTKEVNNLLRANEQALATAKLSMADVAAKVCIISFVINCADVLG